MQIPASLLVLALSASSVSAGPTHRRHQKFHEQKRALGDIVTAVIDGKTVQWANDWDPSTAAAQATGVAPAPVAAAPAAPAAPAPAAAAPVVAAEGASKPVADVVDAVNDAAVKAFTPFCGGKVKRATLEDITAKGNTGIDGDWGCNMQLVDSGIAKQYDNTVKFTNTASEDWKCNCFNKIGRTGEVNGFFGKPALEFSIPANTVQNLAVDANSQGGCACAPGDSVPQTSFGQWAGNWLEFDMASARNSQWSGLDISALVAQAYNMPVGGMQVCDAAGTTCSTVHSDGSGDNAYTKGMEALDGVGLNLPPGKVRANVKLGI